MLEEGKREMKTDTRVGREVDVWIQVKNMGGGKIKETRGGMERAVDGG